MVLYTIHIVTDRDSDCSKSEEFVSNKCDGNLENLNHLSHFSTGDKHSRKLVHSGCCW